MSFAVTCSNIPTAHAVEYIYLSIDTIFQSLSFLSLLRKFYDRQHDFVTEYLCSVWHNHNPYLSSYMTYHRICNQSNAASATSESGTAYPFSTFECIPDCSGVRVAQYFGLCVVFCRLLFVFLSILFLLFYCLSRFTTSYYSYGIFKVFMYNKPIRFKLCQHH